jgi:hypothetical protein
MFVNKYLRLTEKTSEEDLKKKMRDIYDNNDHVRLIIDTTDSNMSMKGADKIKSVFDGFEKETEEKLKDVFIIVKGDVAKTILGAFVNNLKNKKPVKII